MRRFNVNDQAIKNSKGFYVLTSGISLDRFKSNPVMLDGHSLANSAVIGKWEDFESKDGILSMKPVFDIEDPSAAIIEGKVKRGFLKGCSLGIIWNQEDLEWIGEKLVLTKCELFEVSIVAVPSNKNAIHLYNSSLELLTDDQVTSILSLHPNEIKIQNHMKKIALSVAVYTALGIESAEADGVSASLIEAKVLGLSNKLESLEDENQKLKQKELSKLALEKETFIDKAIAQGQIKSTQKETFMKLDIAVAKEIISGIPTSKSLSHQINNSGAVSEVKTLDDFQKLSLEAQLSFKEDNNEAYLNLFKN